MYDVTQLNTTQNFKYLTLGHWQLPCGLNVNEVLLLESSENNNIISIEVWAYTESEAPQTRGRAS